MREERVEVKSYTYKYIADDGSVFTNADQCKEYERTQMSVVEANYKRNVIKVMNGEVFPSLSCDDWVELYDIKDRRALDYLNQYLAKKHYTTAVSDGEWTEEMIEKQFGKNAEYHRDLLGTPHINWVFVPLDDTYIGTKVLLHGYDDDVYSVATKEEMLKDYEATLDGVFKEEK